MLKLCVSRNLAPTKPTDPSATLLPWWSRSESQVVQQQAGIYELDSKFKILIYGVTMLPYKNIYAVWIPPTPSLMEALGTLPGLHKQLKYWRDLQWFCSGASLQGQTQQLSAH